MSRKSQVGIEASFSSLRPNGTHCGVGVRAAWLGSLFLGGCL